MNFDDYKTEDLPPLSPEDEKKPLAYIYYQGRHELATQEEKDAIRPGHPLAPEDIVTIEEACRMYLDPEESRKGPKMGYGLTPEGIGYACTNADIPGYDFDVRAFHMKWVAEDPGFHYKLWYPGAHEIHYNGGAVEDCGWGMMNIYMGTPAPVPEVGLPENFRQVNPYTATVLLFNGYGRIPEDEEKSGFSTVLHMSMNKGEHQWSFGLFGAHIHNGKIVDLRTDYEKEHPEELLERARAMTSHFLYENTQLSFLMRKVYSEYGGKIAPYDLPQMPEGFEPPAID